MAVSLRSVRSIALVVALLTIPVLLLRSAVLEPHSLSAFDRSVRRIGAPLEAAIAYSAGTLGAFFERWVLQARMQSENEDLLRENRELKQKVRELVQVGEENRELRRALQMRDRVPLDMLAAERVGVDQSPFFRVLSIRIDRGLQYVEPGMAVLVPDGVVGRVDKTLDEYSDVMLITDPRSKIAVEMARTRAQGILEGSGEDACSVVLPLDFEVQEGDLVQTSGVDERFPKGYPVGQVVAVEPMVGDRQLVRVLPSVRFDRIDAVWVVLAGAPVPDPLADRAVEPERSVGLQPVR